jgi:hypothetical protein
VFAAPAATAPLPKLDRPTNARPGRVSVPFAPQNEPSMTFHHIPQTGDVLSEIRTVRLCQSFVIRGESCGRVGRCWGVRRFWQ